jgi:YihY family inner membrane protein
MADPVRADRVGARRDLSIRSQPQRTAMALDHLGSAFAAIAWLAASALFSRYVAHFGSYNRTYGSLGAIIGFMTWMWVSIIVVLMGADRRDAASLPPHLRF